MPADDSTPAAAAPDTPEIVTVTTRRVACDGTGGVLCHPRVYLEMGEGDFVGWEAGTGITHVVMNNSDADAILLVGGEASRLNGQCWYPYHPNRKKEMGPNHWDDHPIPKLGPHDGLPRLPMPMPSGRAFWCFQNGAVSANTRTSAPRCC